MPMTWSEFERRARHLMAAVALLMVLILSAVRLDLISAAPVYNNEAWYAQSERSGVVIINEYSSEAECRRNAQTITECRSGKAMMNDERLHRAGRM